MACFLFLLLRWHLTSAHHTAYQMLYCPRADGASKRKEYFFSDMIYYSNIYDLTTIRIIVNHCPSLLNGTTVKQAVRVTKETKVMLFSKRLPNSRAHHTSLRRLHGPPPKPLTLLSRLLRDFLVSRHMLLQQKNTKETIIMWYSTVISCNHLFVLRLTGYGICMMDTLRISDSIRHLQATALVCYEVREICQGKAVPKVKQRHYVWSQNSAPWREWETQMKKYIYKNNWSHRFFFFFTPIP